MANNDHVLSIETATHVIELYEGCLTIGTKKFPDDCVSLTSEETEAVLKLLLLSRGTAQPPMRRLKVDVDTIHIF